jgi:hypothetical protein
MTKLGLFERFRLPAGIACMALFAPFVVLGIADIRINTSPSLPMGLYRVTPDQGRWRTITPSAMTTARRLAWAWLHTLPAHHHRGAYAQESSGPSGAKHRTKRVGKRKISAGMTPGGSRESFARSANLAS